MGVVRRFVFATAVATALLAAYSDGPAIRGASSPATFHCAFDVTCPEVLVEGDPHATIGGDPAPFRGYGDPAWTLGCAGAEAVL